MHFLLGCERLALIISIERFSSVSCSFVQFRAVSCSLVQFRAVFHFSVNDVLQIACLNDRLFVPINHIWFCWCIFPSDLLRDSGLDTAEPQNPLFSSIIAEEITAESCRPIAYACYTDAYSTLLGKTCYITDLFIRAGHRGHGLGKKMIYELLRISKENGCHCLELHCERENGSALKFYENLGMINLTKSNDCHVYAVSTEE